MNWFAIGLILDTLGKLLLGITVLMVHWHVFKEHKIDVDVLRIMKWERIFGVLGILFIIGGSILMAIYR